MLHHLGGHLVVAALLQAGGHPGRVATLAERDRGLRGARLAMGGAAIVPRATLRCTLYAISMDRRVIELYRLYRWVDVIIWIHVISHGSI
jgi:hypothetical protein